MLKEIVTELMVRTGIMKWMYLYSLYCSEMKIYEELRKEKVTDVSLEGLITEGEDIEGKQFNWYNIMYSVKTEDNKDLLFIERYRMEKGNEKCHSHSDSINQLLDLSKIELMKLFKEKGNDHANISITYYDERINNPERDSKRMSEIFADYNKKRHEKLKAS